MQASGRSDKQTGADLKNEHARVSVARYNTQDTMYSPSNRITAWANSTLAETSLLQPCGASAAVYPEPEYVPAY